MSWLNPPASMMFVTDVSATRRRESESSVSISFRYGVVSPSGPPDEPGGNDRSSCRIVKVLTVMAESHAAGYYYYYYYCYYIIIIYYNKTFIGYTKQVQRTEDSRVCVENA